MNVQNIISMILAGLFGSSLALAASVVPSENLICTRDINEWRQAGNCFCPAKTSYDERIGLCVKGAPEHVAVLGEIRTDIFAIGGETTGVLLKSQERDQYELILPNNLLQLVQDLDAKGQLFEVRGEYILVPGVEIPERPSIIVNSISAV